jgi:hypothetical protein
MLYRDEVSFTRGVLTIARTTMFGQKKTSCYCGPKAPAKIFHQCLACYLWFYIRSLCTSSMLDQTCLHEVLDQSLPELLKLAKRCISCTMGLLLIFSTEGYKFLNSSFLCSSPLWPACSPHPDLPSFLMYVVMLRLGWKQHKTTYNNHKHDSQLITLWLCNEVNGCHFEHPLLYLLC